MVWNSQVRTGIRCTGPPPPLTLGPAGPQRAWRLRGVFGNLTDVPDIIHPAHPPERCSNTRPASYSERSDTPGRETLSWLSWNQSSKQLAWRFQKQCPQQVKNLELHVTQ